MSDNPPPNSVIYSATKGALDVVTKVLSKELGARNIRVNTIAPGGVDTEGARTLVSCGAPAVSDLHPSLKSRIDLKLEPLDAAKLAARGVKDSRPS